MNHRKYVSCLVIIAFLFSLYPQTGPLNTRTAFAYDAPPKDQGHTGPDPLATPPDEPPFIECTAVGKQSPGSPVTLQTGDFYYSHNDLYIKCRGPLSLQIERRYHSQNVYEGPFGYGWSFDLLMELILVTEGDKQVAAIRKGDGKRLQFQKNKDGTFSPPASIDDTLVQNPDGSYDLRKKTGTCSTCAEQSHFDSTGKLIYVRDAYNNQLNFAYDTSGKVSSVSDPCSRTLTFSYGENNKITELVDPAGRKFSYSYDDQGNLITYTDPAGGITTYTYDAAHNLTSIKDPRGNIIHSITYDSNDRLSTYTENGGTWQLSYYPDSNRTDQKDPNGKTWSYYFNAAGQMTQKTDPSGNTIRQGWDDKQNLISETDARGYQSTYTYDSAGNRLTEKDPNGKTTTYTYDPATSQIATITDALGRVTKYEYDSTGRRTKRIRDYNGALQNQIVYSYDSKGNIAAVTDPMGNITSYAYDDCSNLVQVTDPLGYVTKYTYDILGNTLTMINPRGYTTTYSYDSLNRLVSITNAMGTTSASEYDGNGNLTKSQDELGSTTTYSYDSYDNIIQITDPLNHSTASLYDTRGNYTKRTDANGGMTIFTYNAIDQLTDITNALNNTTSYTTDPDGNTLTIKDPAGRVTTNYYNAINKVTKTLYPDGKIEQFSYDAVGNLITKTDRKGNTIQYTYDNLNRITKITYPDGTSTTYSYDLNSNLIAAGNPHVSYAFVYDALNRITKVTNATLGKSLSYTYLCRGLKSSMTNPEGKTTTYTYDSLDRLVSLTNYYGESTTYTYDTASRIIGKVLANGLSAHYQYDAADHLVKITNKASTGTTLSEFAYAYDAAGRRTSLTTPAGTHTYTYDAIHELKTAAHPDSPAENYTYDSVYNRLTSTGASNWTYDVSNRLVSFASLQYTYDSNGNMIKQVNTADGTSADYKYDFENRLVRIEYSDGTYTEYRYDPFGNRIIKNLNGTTTWFLHDIVKTLPDVSAEYASDGTLGKSFTHGFVVDDIISARIGSNSYFYTKDGLGSVIAIFDAAQTQTNTYQYDSFGVRINKSESIDNAYGYTGALFDNESKLMYFRARYYNPEIGRFITEDSINFFGGINFYAYVLNNPVNLIDPHGLVDWDAAWSKTKSFAWGATKVGGAILGGFLAGAGLVATGVVAAGSAPVSVPVAVLVIFTTASGGAVGYVTVKAAGGEEVTRWDVLEGASWGVSGGAAAKCFIKGPKVVQELTSFGTRQMFRDLYKNGGSLNEAYALMKELLKKFPSKAKMIKQEFEIARLGHPL